jgi:pantoate--beta-alanine ligase
MEVITSIAKMRDLARSMKREGKRVAFVPTMGALHRGHGRLISEAARQSDIAVVSSFLNPLQFDDKSDLERYPRTPEADQKLAAEAGAKIFFSPTADDFYPPGFLTTANVAHLTATLEGASRPGHFRGVCTAVLKLLNIVQPTVAIFGWKDAQQFIVLKHMVDDLCLDVSMMALTTVRDPDGLALSSRNVLLKPEQRDQALALSRALRRCHFLVRKQNITHCGELLQALRSTLNSAGAQTDYCAIVSRTTLEPLDMIVHGNTLVALAAKVGNVRLIDNTRF